MINQGPLAGSRPGERPLVIAFFVRPELVEFCREMAGRCGLREDDVAIVSLNSRRRKITLDGDRALIEADCGTLRHLCRQTKIVYLPARLSHGDHGFFAPRSSEKYAEFSSLQWDAPWLHMMESQKHVIPSRYSDLARATCKPLQLTKLGAEGIKLPAWCATSDPDEAERFIRQRGRVVAKHLSESRRISSRLLSRASIVTEDDVSALDGETPLLLQELVPAEREFRVFVYRGEAICLEIPRLADSDCVDVKFQNGGRMRASLLANDRLAARACEVVASLGVNYAAVDFIGNDPEDAFFLEANPLGAWEWWGPDIATAVGAFMSEQLIKHIAILEG